MVEVTLTPAATADDDEVAACLVAIRCLLEQEAIDNSDAEAPPNLWRRAAFIEATGRAVRVSNVAKVPRGKNLWRSFNGAQLLMFFVAGIACGGQPARANDLVAPPAMLRPPIPTSNVVRNAQTSLTTLDLAPGTMPPLAPQAATGDVDRPPPLPNPAEAISINQPLPGIQRRIVRVLLSGSKTAGQFSCPDGAILKDASTGDVLAQFPPQSRWQVTLRATDTYPQLSFTGTIGSARHSTVLIASRAEYRSVAFTSPALPMPPNLVPMPSDAQPSFWLPASKPGATTAASTRTYVLAPLRADGIIGCSGKLYRGWMVIKPTSSGTYDVINYVDLEDYLQSVVPSEMPSGWPLEALKAQVIAARSYAVANFGKHEADGYDLKNNTEDQVYAGVGCESANSNMAVAQTRDMVLRYNGAVVTAYFHSASGGWTEQAENVWNRPLPYLRAVADYDDQAPSFNWTRCLAVADVEQSLQRSGKQVGKLLTLMPVARGASPRVSMLLAVGTDRSALISGEEVRKLFGLPSTVFNVGGNGQSYVFAGRGFGHGLGMSQWGAKRLSEAGYTANDILNYYYKDVRIERL